MNNENCGCDAFYMDCTNHDIHFVVTEKYAKKAREEAKSWSHLVSVGVVVHTLPSDGKDRHEVCVYDPKDMVEAIQGDAGDGYFKRPLIARLRSEGSSLVENFGVIYGTGQKK